MTYSAFEDSTELGTPVELYEFRQGSQRWNRISGATSLLYQGYAYTPAPIVRSSIKQTGDVFKDSLKLSFPRDDDFANQFLGYPPELVTTVTILRGHWGDPDSEFIFYWKGRIVSAKAGGNQIDLECESVFTSVRRPGLRARFEYGCRWTLYLKGCNVDRELYKATGQVSSISGGLGVTIAEAALQPDGYYTGGMLLTPDGTPRFITAHVGDLITLARPIFELVGGDNVTLYPGCDHLKETCGAKFNNLDNHGGFPFTPTRNPFDGSSII